VNRRFALVALVFINVLWGSTYAVTKVALTELSPTLLGVLRFTIGTGLLWLIQLWIARGNRSASNKAGFEYVPMGDKLRIGGLGVLGVGLAYLFDYFGINLSTATDASLMIIGEVIFTSLLAMWLMKEHMGRWKTVGITLGVAGVVVLVLGHVTDEPGAVNGGITRTIGDLLILCALLC
jgi:drug/metabolite transporter (DMT)-like permease